MGRLIQCRRDGPDHLAIRIADRPESILRIRLEREGIVLVENMFLPVDLQSQAARQHGSALGPRRVLRRTVAGAAAGMDDEPHQLDLGNGIRRQDRSEEHTSELQSLMRTSYAVFCLNKKKTYTSKIKR